MHKGYRILSVEGADIYKAETKNGAAVGIQLPEKSSGACFRLFKVFLDNSLDSAELEKAYTRVCRKRFSFADEYGNAYTLAVINVKFNYIFKPEGGKPVSLKALREHFYTNGFCVDGVHYVRYKRSAGSSREGKCLFIDERLFRAMGKWSDCGLKPQKDLASWESYKALSLSSVKGTIEIPLESILFVPDHKSTFTEKVVSVEIKTARSVPNRRTRRSPTTSGTAKAFWTRACLRATMRKSICCSFATSSSSRAAFAQNYRNGLRINISL